MENKELYKVYWYWLCNIPGIGRKKIERLLKEYETPENVFRQKSIEWLGEKENASFVKSRNEKWISRFERMEASGIRLITIDDEEYPKRFVCLEDRPYILYVKGKLPCEDKPTCGIVGARTCTRYGAEFARETGKLLAKNGIQVISGMARGIDGESQSGALLGGGESFAVLGNGVDICYPQENWRLYEALFDKGGIISEFAPGTRAKAVHFPMRNRIISALSDKLIVVEAKERSGSLITVDFALEQGKEVFGVPGRVTDELSRGVNNILKLGAGVLTSPSDILTEYGKNPLQNELNFEKIKNTLAERENMLYSKLDLEPKNLQIIIEETGMGMAEVSDILLELEMKGFVVECGQNNYARAKI